MATDPSTTAQNQGAEKWFITTDFFANGGDVYNGWGPFPSRELALRVRELVEMLPIHKSRGRTFAVDKQVVRLAKDEVEA